MRVPLQWLTDYVDVDLSTDELAHRLTMFGLKVESIDRTAADWQDVYVGLVTEVAPHPKSNKPLWVTRVDLGDRSITVVTGAQNVRPGDRIPVVLVGGLLPHGPDGEPMRIEPRPMAGIISEGMLASALELGISEEHSGILVLPPDAPVGAPLREIMGGDVLDIETNPNRPDTLSITGIAREVAALTHRSLTLPDLDVVDSNVDWIDTESILVEVRDPELCPRYSALRIDGLAVSASPLWLADRLQAAGMRSINLLVDITNYVMLEYGQPMHAFDATQLTGDRIVVRRARAWERITTLDGAVRVLTPENLVIADGERAVAIAGVMGGENSEISDDTTCIVLESATFDPVSVRRTAQSFGLRTEASSRFEKGLPLEQTVLGLRRYLQLLSQITGDPLRVSHMSDVSVPVPESRVVTMPMRDLHRLVGVPISREQAAESLSLLGFGVRFQGDTVYATVPFWRRADIELSADLVEEVARTVGYDTLPATMFRRTMPPHPMPPMLQKEGKVRDCLLATGASESVTHSLTSPGFMERLVVPGHDGACSEQEQWARLIPNAAGVYAHGALMMPVRLANPATRDRQMLRLTLVPSLLDVAAHNLKHTDERIAFFEIGRAVFGRSRNEELPYERRTLAVVQSGLRQPVSWRTPQPGPYTFFDIKGVLAAVMETLRVPDWRAVPSEHPALHPGRSAAIRLDGQDVAYFGQLHPAVADAFDMPGWPVQVAELDLDAVFAVTTDASVFRPLPRYPAAYRDIAVIVDAVVAASDVTAAVQTAGGELLDSLRIFDVYTGDAIPAGKKSMAIGMTFRAPGATLTQDEVAGVMSRVVSTLQHDVGASLRE